MDPTPPRQLTKPPIIEAVFDFDCDLRPDWSIAACVEEAKAAFSLGYPKLRIKHFHEQLIENLESSAPQFSYSQGISALQFLQEDERQVVQVRAEGFTLNRLTPYPGFVSIVAELGMRWHQYAAVAKPVEVQQIRLRYINRIPLPIDQGDLRISDWILGVSTLPTSAGMIPQRFVSQHVAVDAVGHEVTVVVANQAREGDKLAVVLDLTAKAEGPYDPTDWPALRQRLEALRQVKNRIFDGMLTERCRELFQ